MKSKVSSTRLVEGGPLRRGERRVLWLLFAVTLVSGFAHVGMYVYVERPEPLPELRLEETAKTVEQRSIGVAASANRTAFNVIQAAAYKSMRDKARISAKWSLLIAGLCGLLLFRLRGIRAI